VIVVLSLFFLILIKVNVYHNILVIILKSYYRQKNKCIITECYIHKSM